MTSTFKTFCPPCSVVPFCPRCGRAIQVKYSPKSKVVVYQCGSHVQFKKANGAAFIATWTFNGEHCGEIVKREK